MFRDETLAEELNRAPGGKRRGRRSKKEAANDDGIDKHTRSRVRKTPEVTELYKMIRRYNLREEAFKILVLSRLDETQTRRVRKLLLQKTALLIDA